MLKSVSGGPLHLHPLGLVLDDFFLLFPCVHRGHTCALTKNGTFSPWGVIVGRGCWAIFNPLPLRPHKPPWATYKCNLFLRCPQSSANVGHIIHSFIRLLFGRCWAGTFILERCWAHVFILRQMVGALGMHRLSILLDLLKEGTPPVGAQPTTFKPPSSRRRTRMFRRLHPQRTKAPSQRRPLAAVYTFQKLYRRLCRQ